MTRMYGDESGEPSQVACRVSRYGEPEKDIILVGTGLREAVDDILSAGAQVESLRFVSREARKADFGAHS